jgi:hypothetical protein
MGRRSTLIATLAAAGVFTLVACSSNGAAGNASPASTPGTSSAASSAAAGGSATGGSAAASTPAGSATASSANGGDTSSSAAQSSQQEPSTTASTDQSTITVGGNVDAQTANWFGAFCTGMSPLITAMQGGAIPTGGTDMQSTMVKEFTTLGDAMTNTANILKPLPPPTFTNGGQFASDVVASLSQAGPQMKSAAADIKAVDPSNPTALQAAIEKAGTALSTSMSGLDKYDLDTNTQDAMKKIPACAPFAAASGGAGATTS